MKKISLKLFVIVIIMLFIFSCVNKTREINKIENNPDKPLETIMVENISNKSFETPEQLDNSNTTYEKYDAIINSDCDYWIRIGGDPSGKFLKGQEIIILDYFYPGTEEDSIIKVFVEVETKDGAVRGRINEYFITYLDNIENDIGLKNITLTRDFYYQYSVENIYKREYSGFEEKYGREQAIREMGHFFSEHRILISERYFSILAGDLSFALRILSIKRDGDTYTLHLSNNQKEEFELVLIDDGNGITFIHFAAKDGDNHLELSFLGLNIKYIPNDSEKSRILKENVSKWVQENRGN